MAFADWVKRSDLAASALARHPNLRSVLQAAYKAGERQGRADALELAERASELDKAMRAVNEVSKQHNRTGMTYGVSK